MKRLILGFVLMLWAMAAGAQLTQQQAATLKTAILADATAAAAFSGGDLQAVANRMNTKDAAFFVWHSTTPIQTIFDAITWANLTPADTPDGTTLYTNRALYCSAKQQQLLVMLGGRTILNATISTLRAGLQDALTNLPCGVGGATVAAGWTTVRDTAIKRTATLAEKALANVAGGNGQLATPATATWEGNLTFNDVVFIRDNG